MSYFDHPWTKFVGVETFMTAVVVVAFACASAVAIVAGWHAIFG